MYSSTNCSLNPAGFITSRIEEINSQADISFLNYLKTYANHICQKLLSSVTNSNLQVLLPRDIRDREIRALNV